MNSYVNEAIDAIAMLSASSEDQISYLDKIGANPDELFLDLEDAYVILEKAIEAGSQDISQEEFVIIKSMYQYLSKKMYNENIWERNRLNSPEWEEIRGKSAHALRVLSR